MSSVKVSGLVRIREKGDPSPFPIAVKVGDFIFAPCIVNLNTQNDRLLDVRPSRDEAKAVLVRLKSVMEQAGGTLSNVINLLQLFLGRGQTAGYVEERLGHFPDGVPTSTGSGGTALAWPRGLIQLDAVGIAPSGGRKLEYIGGTSVTAGYSNAIAYGDVVYFSGVMTNAPETMPNPAHWFGSAVKNEIRFIMEKKLGPILAESGVTREDIAVAHFHLLDAPADYGAFREALDELFPGRKPLMMISASSGLGALPGRVEITPIAVRKGGKTTIADINLPDLPPGIGGGPQARRVGDFVYISTQTAVDGFGHLSPSVFDQRLAHFRDQTTGETDLIVDRLEALLKAAKCDGSSLVRLRVYVNDIKHAPAAIAVIRRRLGDDMPLSLVEDSGAAGWLGAATVSVDAVAYAPQG